MLPSAPVRSSPDANRAGDAPSDKPVAMPSCRVDSPCTPPLSVKFRHGPISVVALMKCERCLERMALLRSPIPGASPGSFGAKETTSRPASPSNLVK